MAYRLDRKMVIGVSSRALFDLTVENDIFEHCGVEAYCRYQVEHEQDILKPGPGFELIRSLAGLNERCGEDLVEIIVMSRNSPDTSLRVFNTIAHYGLPITRSVLVSGASLAPYLEAFHTDLFLSACEEDVQSAIDSGIAAGIICTGLAGGGQGQMDAWTSSPYGPGQSGTARTEGTKGSGQVIAMCAASRRKGRRHADRDSLGGNCGAGGDGSSTVIPEGRMEGQVRMAFDGDAVLFTDESERIFREQGLDAFEENERRRAREPLAEGPFARFLKKLSDLQSHLGIQDCPIRTALVTSRSAPAHERVIRTMRAWNVRVDEVFFLGGLEKKEVLKAFGAQIFFDDQSVHTQAAAQHVPAARVPYRFTGERDAIQQYINRHFPGASQPLCGQS